ncbi:hypothetical protein BK332_11015 [Escherichia coli]|nr:hypothetical protein BK332_11015 [Escherichia coli]
MLFVLILSHRAASYGAIMAALRELEKFRQQGFSPEQVIRHSIANEYQGLFVPKGVRPETLLRQVNTVSLPDSAIPPGFRG